MPGLWDLIAAPASAMRGDDTATTPPHSRHALPQHYTPRSRSTHFTGSICPPGACLPPHAPDGGHRGPREVTLAGTPATAFRLTLPTGEHKGHAARRGTGHRSQMEQQATLHLELYWRQHPPSTCLPPHAPVEGHRGPREVTLAGSQAPASPLTLPTGTHRGPREVTLAGDLGRCHH